MDSSDGVNSCLVEETTTVIFEGAVTARRRRMEIRRFKKVSGSPVPHSSLSFVHQGIFKRSRPVRTTRICSVCYHENDAEEDCDGFPSSKVTDARKLPFTSRFPDEVKVPQTFSEAYVVSDGDISRESRLMRSKSFPSECLHTGRCLVHITKATHDHVALNVEGHFLSVVSDNHGSSLKGTWSDLCSFTAEAIGSLDPGKSNNLPVKIPLNIGISVKEPPLPTVQQDEENVSHLNPGTDDVESENMDSKEVRCSVDAQMSDPTDKDNATSGHTEVNTLSMEGDNMDNKEVRCPSDAQMSDPADKDNVTSGRAEVNTSIISTSSFALAEPLMSPVRCPLSGKVLVRGRRREMEDTAVISPSFTRIPCTDNPEGSCDLHFFAVYDGHGGAQASNYCAERLHRALAEELASSPVTEGMRDDSEWVKVMASCFLKVDKEVGGVCPNGGCDVVDNTATCCENAIAPENVGTTAVIAVFSPSQIVIANCGDSRAVLSRGGVAIPVSNDHKPERDDETSRIEAAGGRVIYWDGYRVAGLLAVSRALGDRYLKQFVISEPDVLCLPRTDADECLILASDGLWDVVSNDTACDIARRCFASARRRSGAGEDTASASVAALLVKLAYGRGSKDNISVVVIDLKSRNL